MVFLKLWQEVKQVFDDNDMLATTTVTKSLTISYSMHGNRIKVFIKHHYKQTLIHGGYYLPK